jgi:hypothetical protein
MLIGGIVGGVVLLVALCGGGGFLAVQAFTQPSYKKDSCVKHEQADGESKAVPTGCAEPNAFRVVEKLEDTTSTIKCPAEPASDATFINYQDKFVLCLKKVG